MQLRYNDYVPYYNDAAEKAAEICKDLTTEEEKFNKICKWITTNIIYDYIKAVLTSKKKKEDKIILPDVKNCFINRRGVCSDIAALTCSMMRSQGLEAYYVVGKVYHMYMGVKMAMSHAWVEVKIDNNFYQFDATVSSRRSKKLEYCAISKY